MRIILSITFILAVLTACQQEPPVKTLNKDHAIEVSYETKKLNDSQVLLICKENVYLKGIQVRHFLRVDTLPALGDTIHEVELNDQETTSVPAPKEYEFFVTVK